VRKTPCRAPCRSRRLREDLRGILILFDPDDELSAELAPTLEEWAREAGGADTLRGGMANREYEAWFLARQLEALRGRAGIAAVPANARHPGDAGSWISIASQEMFRKARTEPLITLVQRRSANTGFRSVVLGQLGEARLEAAIDVVIAGQQAQCRKRSMRIRGSPPRYSLPCRDHRSLFESRVGRRIKSRISLNWRSLLASPKSIRPRSTPLRCPWKADVTSFARLDQTVSVSVISRQ